MVWNYGEAWTWDPALQAYHTALIATADDVLLSRKMAEEGFIGHWERMAANTANPQSVFAGHIRDARKVVFTHTLDRVDWPNTVLATGDLIEEVNALKRQQGKNLIVFGGVSFVAALISAGLIDEYHLIINPAVIGRGMPIFDKVKAVLGLSLVVAGECCDVPFWHHGAALPLCRLVTEQQYAFIQLAGSGELQACLDTVGKETLAGAHDNRMYQQLVFIDQACFGQRPYQFSAAFYLYLPTRLLFQPGDFLFNILPDNGRILPGGFL